MLTHILHIGLVRSKLLTMVRRPFCASSFLVQVFKVNRVKQIVGDLLSSLDGLQIACFGLVVSMSQLRLANGVL